MGLKGPQRSENHGITAWVEETLKIIEPWSDGVDGLGGTLRIVEAWDHGMDGLGGALNLTELQLPATGCVDQHTQYFSEGKIRLVRCWQSGSPALRVSQGLAVFPFTAALLSRAPRVLGTGFQPVYGWLLLCAP